MCGGIFGGSPSLPPPAPSPAEAVAERDKEVADAKAKARIAAANASGRRSQINPSSGALGVVDNLNGVSSNSLF